MRSPVCILAESEPGSLDRLAAALDSCGMAFEFREPEAISARDDPAISVVTDARAVVTGRMPAALGSAPTAPPLLLAASERDRLPVSAALALGFADTIDPAAAPEVLRRRIVSTNRFGLRRRVLRVQQIILETYAPLERPDDTSGWAASVTNTPRPHVMLAGPGGSARVAIIQMLTGWARTTLSHGLDLAQDTTDLDLVVLTGPPRGEFADQPATLLTGMPSRPAPILAAPGAWADAADTLPIDTAPEVVRMRLRSWLSHREAERRLRAAVDRWEHAAIVDPPSRLLGRAFLTDMLDGLLVAPGGATTSVVGIGFDGLEDVNRSLGHAMGQRVLRLVGQAIASIVRAEDIAGRVQGGQFVIALPDSDEAAATALAGRLVARLSALRLPGMPDTRFRTATAAFRHGQDAARLVQTALDRLDLASARSVPA